MSECRAAIPVGPGQWRECGVPAVAEHVYACVHEHVRRRATCAEHAPQPGMVGCQQCWDAGHGMIVIEVRGLPAAQGSKRHVGGGRMIESSKAVGPWREAVRAETQRAMKEQDGPLEGAVFVSVTFGLSRPRAHYRTGRHAGELKPDAPDRPAVRPDLDKLLRAVLDGLTAGGAWRDDAQVALIEAAKQYGTPGCWIEVRKP